MVTASSDMAAVSTALLANSEAATELGAEVGGGDGVGGNITTDDGGVSDVRRGDLAGADVAALYLTATGAGKHLRPRRYPASTAAWSRPPPDAGV